VSDPLAEAPLNQVSGKRKCGISGLQKSLGSGTFIEHQINYSVKQEELLRLKGHLK
jgi:hypothetical protein